MNRRILIAEDDPSVARLIGDNLRFEGFQVQETADGREALARVQRFHPHLVLLDSMLPGIDGFEVCRRLNESIDPTPVILLSARNQHSDKIRGLELGADDYITKPFALDELLARVRAVLRRTQRHAGEIVLGEVTIDFLRLTATRKERRIGLTDREFAVLRRLADRVGYVVSRDELLRVVWGYDAALLTRAVDNLMVRLRRKIEPDPHKPRFIRTAHGDGYRLTLDS
jgi:DNA-binding response OmpR family regulator